MNLATFDYHLVFSHRFQPMAFYCAMCGATLAEIAQRPKLLCVETDAQRADRLAWQNLGKESAHV